MDYIEIYNFNVDKTFAQNSRITTILNMESSVWQAKSQRIFFLPLEQLIKLVDTVFIEDIMH